MGAKKYGDVIVVDDNSTDNTKKVSESLGAFVVYNRINVGYSQSLEKGIKKAVGLRFTHSITMDADGEHSPRIIENYLKLFKNNDLILGVRNKRARLAEKLIGSYFKREYGVNDITCGMKGLNLRLIKNSKIMIVENNLGLSIYNYLLRNNIGFSELKVDGVKRIDKSRYGSFFLANMKILITLFRLLFVNHLRSPLKSLIKKFYWFSFKNN